MSSLIRLSPSPPIISSKDLSPKSAVSRPFKGSFPYSLSLPQTGIKRQFPYRTSRYPVSVARDSSSGNTGWYDKLNSDMMVNAHKVFDGLPQPVKNFPWIRMLGILRDLIFELASFATKYMFIPVLAISSLSEMSYCAYERKMSVIPIGFLLGFGIALAFRDATVDFLSDLTEGDKPWHLILIGVFFILLKWAGPYCPYFARLLVPHFANGGLCCTVWSMFMWQRKHNESAGASIKHQ